MKVPDTKELLIDDSPVSYDDFRRQNLVNVIGSIIFMIAGPFSYTRGFIFSRGRIRSSGGALAIALGSFVRSLDSISAGPGGAGPARMYVRDV